MRLCAELADIGMQLARAAAARAITEWAEPEPPPAEAPAPEPAPAPQAAKRTAAPAKPADPALLFTRLAAAVLNCIALEARLAEPKNPVREGSAVLRTDPRRIDLREAFRLVTENHPDQSALLREADARIDEELIADAAQQVAMPIILFALCDELGIEINYAVLPDKYLDFAPAPSATPPPF